MTPEPEMVAVEQCNRDKAAEYFETIAPLMPHIVAEARKSPSLLARMFAEHRLAARERTDR